MPRAPFGERRFRPPEPAPAWEGERDATTFGPTAPQAPYRGGLERYLPTVQIDGSDILTVNVWAPADGRRTRSSPCSSSCTAERSLAGRPLFPVTTALRSPRHGIVYVSIQYRLGQEGFAVLDDVPQNLGVLDQEAALRWVRREIAAFGGDPARVTAMGHSAGASPSRRCWLCRTPASSSTGRSCRAGR